MYDDKARNHKASGTHKSKGKMSYPSAGVESGLSAREDGKLSNPPEAKMTQRTKPQNLGKISTK